MMMGKSVFSYFITENKSESERFASHLPVEREFGKYILRTDSHTPFAFASVGEVACAVFGLAVNVISGESDDIAREIAESCASICDVVEYEKNLGGKYILLFQNGEQYYLQGDATCSIPIFYSTEGAFACASNYQSILQVGGYGTDEVLVRIRQSGDISQAMPYDVTPCKQIKQLIPNHYLDVNAQKAVRFVNAAQKQKRLSVEQATELALPMIDNLLALYGRHYKIYCPITSGRDSRVVLSFLLKSKREFCCYTIKHPEHNDSTQDIVVPVALCQKMGIEHRLVEDVTVPDALKEEMDTLLGEGHYSARTLRIAKTVNEYFGDGAILNGDIIGQVGKCSLHRDIPSVFATPSYFRCKLHNYSKGAKIQLGHWLREIKAGGEKVNTFDLFSIENRMGRWAGQENLIYNSLGQAYLNIFNSRAILYVWTAVARKERKKSRIHADLIDKTCCALSDIPFGKDEGMVAALSKATGLTYLLSSYAKFYIEKNKFQKGKRA